MGTNITLMAFNRMEDDKFHGILDYPGNAFNKKKLRILCSKLQGMAVSNDLPVPECIKWYRENVEKTEETTKGLFGKSTKITETAEFTICLYFPKKLSKADYKQWWLICKGIFYTLTPTL